MHYTFQQFAHTGKDFNSINSLTLTRIFHFAFRLGTQAQAETEIRYSLGKILIGYLLKCIEL